ncbi:hypothetical protein WJX84_002438 [Apatococcus fuscideae]|uniref:CYTH domain-containing protein n=1 Tax=Apatococcus fuscideae TaxID=2026836 RepID=A0AAW1T0C2_9CHLO
MLRRKPTRIELRAEDKEEYEAAKRAAAEAKAAQQRADQQHPLSPILQADKKPTAAQRIGIKNGLLVEIKLRLPNQEAHDQVKKALEKHHRVQHAQENVFFDGTQGELNKNQRTCRVRFYNVDKKAVITSKRRQDIVGGVGRAEELEEDVDPKAARSFLGEPDKLLNLNSPLMKKIKQEHGVGSFKCLGGFRNIRDEYDYEGFVLELDETIYPWGTVYEIEVETEDPETLKVKLEKFLNDQKISYKYSTVTKFHNFRKKTLD